MLIELHPYDGAEPKKVNLTEEEFEALKQQQARFQASNGTEEKTFIAASCSFPLGGISLVKEAVE